MTAPDDLTRLTIADAAVLIRRRELSPLELTQAHLSRIEQANPLLNCYLTVMADQALETARQMEQELQRGDYRGALHGIPLALKDLFDTAGIRTTGGSKFFANRVPTDDAYAVARLKTAGAVILGKLNLHEIALGVVNDNPHFGTCRNPRDTNRSPGGSSGGSAASLAANLCMGALGSDTRGSIRIPAALCGVVGLKPTYGRVSLRGVMPLSWSLDHAGPMARTVRDTAILLTALAGHDPGDAYSVDIPADDYLSTLEQGAAGWRIGIARSPYFTEAAPEILSAVERAADIFRQSGAQVSEVDLEFARESRHTSRVIVTADAAAFHRERLAEKPGDFGADVLTRLREGQTYTAVEYALARRSQTMLRHSFLHVFDDYDVLLTATTPVTAPRLDDAAALDTARASLSYFTAPFNMAGLPAMTVPCGWTVDNLPIGLQLISRPWSEAHLLRAAHTFERTFA